MKRRARCDRVRHAGRSARTAQTGALAILLFAAWIPCAAAEPLELVDMNGGRHDADALIAAGHPIVLIFWHTWCRSCKGEAPKIVRAADEYGDTLRFFGVISGPDRVIDDEKVRRVAREWGYVHPQIRDRDLALAKRFRIFGTPVVIVLGDGGRELYRGFRLPDDWAPFVPRPAAQPGREAS
jgi:thiol-disulfide isomerase/thioredoxin